jgi:hypothetical protein
MYALTPFMQFHKNGGEKQMSPIHPGNWMPIWARKALLTRRTSVSFLFAMFALIAASAQVQADTIAPGGSFQSWNASTLSTTGGPYWNNASSDSANANIGWCLAGGGSCSIAGTPGAIGFYGVGNSAVSNIFFNGTGATVSVTFLGGVAGFADTFGWYAINPANPNVVPPAASQHAIAGNSHTATPTPVGQTMTFNAGAGSDYGFYLNNGSQTFFSQSSLNSDSTQHFAIFTDGTSFYIGSEDVAGGGDRDYNDMLVKITPSAPGGPTDVPEPMSMSMLGGGLIVLGGLIRYARRSR